MTEKQTLQEERTMKNRMFLSLLFFVFVMNALAVIVIAPWIFVVTTTFSIAMYVVLSLTFLIFFGVPFFEYRIIKSYIRGESNDRKDKKPCADCAGKAEKADNS